MTFTAIKSGTKQVRSSAAAVPNEQLCLGLISCMVGSMIVSSPKNRSDDDDREDDKAQRKADHNGFFSQQGPPNREPKTSRKTSGAKKAPGADSDDEDLEVVHCEFSDDKSTTDGGDSDAEDELSSTVYSSDHEHTDTEDDEQDESEEEYVNVANWQGMARGMASVLKAAVEEEWMDEDDEEIIDVGSWQNVGSRLAGVFAAEIQAEDEWEAPAKAAGIRPPPGLEAPWRV